MAVAGLRHSDHGALWQRLDRDTATMGALWQCLDQDTATMGALWQRLDQDTATMGALWQCLDRDTATMGHCGSAQTKTQRDPSLPPSWPPS